MTTVANTLIELNRWMGDVAAHAHRATRNLRDTAPGFPTTTPGNGAPGGGSGPTGSIVERLAIEGDGLNADDSLTAAQRLKQLTRQLEPLIRETRDLCLRYGYSAAGEYENNPRRPTPATEAPDGKWCQSCARLQTMEPVGDKGRRNLCRWCADFQDAERILPPLTVLDHRHRGGRMSAVFVQRELRVAKAATKKTKGTTA